MNETIQLALIKGGVSIFTIVITILITILGNFLVNKTKDAKAKKYLKILDEAILKSVIAVNQTFVDDLKEKKNFTLEMQKQALQKAIDSVNGILDDTAKKVLKETIGDIDKYVETMIEANVKLAKEGKLE